MRWFILSILLSYVFSQVFNQTNIRGVPVYAMLSLTTVNNNGQLNNPGKIKYQLERIKSKNVNGVMVDVWWGVVERNGPRNYDFSAWLQLVEMVKSYDMKMQVVFSFHQCGGNVGDDCFIPLPRWVLDIGNSNPDIFYTDKNKFRNKEYLTLGVDDERIFQGRTAIELYRDYMLAFKEAFKNYLGTTITTLEVGTGPAGELRYPSYPLGDGRWQFPGNGEFQCYDKYMLEDLRKHSINFGKPEWGNGGPNNAGNYKQLPHQVPFYQDNTRDNYDSPYGKFFLSWYSDVLIKHGEKVLSHAASIFKDSNVVIATKIAGIHWWYLTSSHPPELTAGYYNTRSHDGYRDIAIMFKKHNIEFQFTCMEMRDSEQNNCGCSPERLVRQTRDAAWGQGIKYAGENALPISEHHQYNKVVEQSSFNGRKIDSFTYLRLFDWVLEPRNFDIFGTFVRNMQSIAKERKVENRIELKTKFHIK